MLKRKVPAPLVAWSPRPWAAGGAANWPPRPPCSPASWWPTPSAMPIRRWTCACPERARGLRIEVADHDPHPLAPRRPGPDDPAAGASTWSALWPGTGGSPLAAGEDRVVRALPAPVKEGHLALSRPSDANSEARAGAGRIEVWTSNPEVPRRGTPTDSCTPPDSRSSVWGSTALPLAGTARAPKVTDAKPGEASSMLERRDQPTSSHEEFANVVATEQTLKAHPSRRGPGREGRLLEQSAASVGVKGTERRRLSVRRRPGGGGRAG
jgi:hypothetical protein